MTKLHKKEILGLIKLKDARPLFRKADDARRRTVGDEVHLRGLIEFS
jgi:biotin synthase-like enzyme